MAPHIWDFRLWPWFSFHQRASSGVFCNSIAFFLYFTAWQPFPPFHSVPGSPHCRGFMIILRQTILGKTSLQEGSALCRDLYGTTQNIHKKTDIVEAGGIRTRNPSKWMASDSSQTTKPSAFCHVVACSDVHAGYSCILLWVAARKCVGSWKIVKWLDIWWHNS